MGKQDAPIVEYALTACFVDSEDEQLPDIDEEVEENADMEDVGSRAEEQSGGFMPDHRDEDVHEEEDSKYKPAARSPAVEKIEQSPTISTTTPRNSSAAKKKRTKDNHDEVSYPELPTVFPDDIGNDTEPQPAARKKSRKSKKSNVESTRLTRSASQMSDMEPAPVYGGDNADRGEEDTVAMLKRTRRESSKPDLVNPRRSSRKASTEPEVPNIITRSRQNSVEVSTHLIKKSVVAKALPRKFKSRGDIYDISEGDDSADAPSRSRSRSKSYVTPSLAKSLRATRSRNAVPDASPMNEEVEEQQSPIKHSQKSSRKKKAVSPAEEEVQESSVEISKKSLGKRKASKSELKSSSKKQKRKFDRAPSGTPPLTAYGFLTSDSPNSGSERPVGNTIPTSSDLKSTAQRLFAEADSDAESAAPPHTDTSPRWTAVNSPPLTKHAPKISPSSSSSQTETILLPPSPLNLLSRPQIILSPYVPGQAASSSEDEETVFVVPKSNEKRKKRKPTVASETRKSTKVLPHATGQSDETEPTSSKPNKKRKRRSPVEDSEAAKSTEPSKSYEINSDVEALTAKSVENQKKRISSKTRQSGDSADSNKFGERGTESRTPESTTFTSRPGSSSSPLSRNPTSHPEYEDYAQAIQMWMMEKNMTQYETNDLIQKTLVPGNRAFWKHMAENIPHIPAAKIRLRCRRLFHNFEARGKWTEEQDIELRRLHSLNPGKWKLIGESMNRFAEDCRDRWRNVLVCGDNLKYDIWTVEEEENLMVIVAECVQLLQQGRKVAGREPYPDEDVMALVHFSTVSEKMGHTRSRLQCLAKWKVLKRRTDSDVEGSDSDAALSETPWQLERAQREADEMSPEQKLYLLTLIRESNAGRESKTPWRNIQNTLGVGNFIRKITLRVSLRTMMANIADYKDMKFQEVIDDLISAYEASIPDEPEGFYTTFLSSQKSTAAARVFSKRGNDRRAAICLRPSRLSQARIIYSDEEAASIDAERDKMEVVGPTSIKAVKVKTKARSNNATRNTSDDDSREAVKSALKVARPSLSKSRITASDDESNNSDSALADTRASRSSKVQKIVKVRSGVDIATSDSNEPLQPSQSQANAKIKAKAKGVPSGKKADMMTEMENDGNSSPVPQPSTPAGKSEKKKKKIRENMKPADSSQVSAEESNSAPVSDGLEDVLSSMRNGMVRTPIRSSQPTPSARRITAHESDDEKEKAQGVFSDDMTVDGSDSSTESDENEDIPAQKIPPNDNDRASDNAAEPIKQHVEATESGDSEDEEEADGTTPTQYASQASVDLNAESDDGEHKITMNGRGKSEATRDDTSSEEDSDDSMEEDSEESDQEERAKNPVKQLASLIRSASLSKPALILNNTEESSESDDSGDSEESNESDEEETIRSPPKQHVTPAKLTSQLKPTPIPANASLEVESDDSSSNTDTEQSVESEDTGEDYQGVEECEESEEEETTKIPIKHNSRTKLAGQSTTPRGRDLSIISRTSTTKIVPPAPKWTSSQNTTPRLSITPQISTTPILPPQRWTPSQDSTPRVNGTVAAQSVDGKKPVTKILPPPSRNSTPRVNVTDNHQIGSSMNTQRRTSVVSSTPITRILPPISRNSTPRVNGVVSLKIGSGKETLRGIPASSNASITPILPPCRNSTTRILPPPPRFQPSQVINPRISSQPARQVSTSSVVAPKISTSQILPPSRKSTPSQGAISRANTPVVVPVKGIGKDSRDEVSVTPKVTKIVPPPRRSNLSKTS